LFKRYLGNLIDSLHNFYSHLDIPVKKGRKDLLKLYHLRPFITGTSIYSFMMVINFYFTDVTVGSILGIVVAYLSYRTYYPALQRLNCHLPYICITPTDTKISYLNHPTTPTSPSVLTDLDHILKTV